MSLSAIATLLLFSTVQSGTATSSSCEASAGIRHEFDRLQASDLHGKEREQAQKALVEQLLAKYPHDLFVHLHYQSIFRGRTEAERQALIDRYHKLAESRPDDAAYQFLYAEALLDNDTPQAIELAQQIVAADPAFTRAHLLLADIYSWGKFQDRGKTQQELDAFFAGCPATLDGSALALAKRYGSAELDAKLIPELKKRLAAEEERTQLEKWETVWNLEFKTRPDTQHDQLRKEISAELDRLQAAHPTGGAAWFAFLTSSYHMAGNEAAAEEQESRLEAQYPSSFQATQLLNEEWSKAHPWPGADEAKQQEYWHVALARADEALKKSPDNEQFLLQRFSALSKLAGTPVDQLMAAADALLTALRQNRDFFGAPPFEMQVARAYLKRKIRLDQVPRLVEEGWASYRHMSGVPSDRAPEEDRKLQLESQGFVTSEAALILLDAALQLQKPEIAKDAVAKADALKIDKPLYKSRQFEVDAKWAELQSRKLDALLLYRAAVDTRPTSSHPDKDDELTQSLDRLLKELGGTEIARALLAKQPARLQAASTDGRWEQPQKNMKRWELKDLNGNTWKLASLEGKIVLINVWATWCGPCKQEHPHLQALYDRVKHDPSIQILTFNIDDEIGNVAPYIKENKYTFPVLFAKDFADDLSVDSIPRNWILDTSGKWRWEQVGFGNEDNWEDEILAKMKSPGEQH